MIEQIIKALTANDSEALAKCFSENCKYYDYCPAMNDMPNIYIYGRECMALLFKKMFVSGDIEVAEARIENEKSATYFGAYGGPYVYARLNIEEYDDDGLVQKVVVHPA